MFGYGFHLLLMFLLMISPSYSVPIKIIDQPKNNIQGEKVNILKKISKVVDSVESKQASIYPSMENRSENLTAQNEGFHTSMRRSRRRRSKSQISEDRKSESRSQRSDTRDEDNRESDNRTSDSSSTGGAKSDKRRTDKKDSDAKDSDDQSSRSRRDDRKRSKRKRSKDRRSNSRASEKSSTPTTNEDPLKESSVESDSLEMDMDAEQNLTIGSLDICAQKQRDCLRRNRCDLLVLRPGQRLSSVHHYMTFCERKCNVKAGMCD